MARDIGPILREIREKDVRELVEDHVRDIDFDSDKKEIVVSVDKRYAINLLHSSRYIPHFITALRVRFGEDNRIVLRLEHPHHGHDREMLIPHAIHY